MNDSQSWYQSRAVLSGIVAVIAGALGLLGYAITPEDQENLLMLLSAAGGLVSGGLAAYYRIKATKQIRK